MKDHFKEKVMHRDLKPANIGIHFSGKTFEDNKERDEFIRLFDFEKDRKTLHVKIFDYGQAKKLKKEDKANSIVGTNGYRAPELLKNDLNRISGKRMDGYTFKVDVWSCGIIFY